MAITLESTTGRSVDDWVRTAQGLGLERHGEIRAALQKDHDLSYGHAYLLASIALGYGQQGEAELVDGLFAGPRGVLRPIYELALEVVIGMGDDVTVVPMKTMVTFRRSKQFACFTPMSAKRVELGVNLRGPLALEAVGLPRLRPTPGGMASHVFTITSPDEIDDEVADWVRRAYQVN